MRFMQLLASAGLITAFALPGFGQASNQYIGSEPIALKTDVCTTLTDLCHANARIDEVSIALIVYVPESDDKTERAHEPILDLPPKSGLSIMHTILGTDEQDASKYISAKPDVQLPNGVFGSHPVDSTVEGLDWLDPVQGMVRH